MIGRTSQGILDFQMKNVTGYVWKEQLEHGCDASFLKTKERCLSAADVSDMDNTSTIFDKMMLDEVQNVSCKIKP